MTEHPSTDDHPSALARRFHLPGRADIVDGHGGLPKVRITSPLATGEMYLHGGQVMAWAPEGVKEVLFVSDRARWAHGHAIRGGVPICFPWFGRHADDPDAPSHGFVRTRAWRLESVSDDHRGVTVSMATGNGDDTRRWWPGDFHAVHRVTFGPSLIMALEIANTGSAPTRFEAALHTYYRVSDVRGIWISGLDATRYLDALDRSREKAQDGDIAILSEIDRVYLDAGPVIEIDDAAARRRIRIVTEGSRTTVVWNPWATKARALPDLGDDEWLEFVCVESANVAPRAVDLAPGERHSMRVEVSVENL
jgi:D-hexose-6-phosphate mutarotase